MSHSDKNLGNWGEAQAAAYLEKQGYKILKRNFRYGRLGEIDLVADDHGMLVFVEVKTQSTDAMGDASNWVTRRKQRQIGRIALAYLSINQIEDRDCRFDVIAVVRTDGKPAIKHLPNAFWL